MGQRLASVLKESESMMEVESRTHVTPSTRTELGATDVPEVV